MGEYTIRELMKRRSGSTQRALQRRRELAQGIKHSVVPKLIGILILLGLVGGAGYVVFLSQQASDRFVVVKAMTHNANTLALANTTEFLPNTLLANQDPSFYNKSSMTGAILTRHLVRLYFPNAAYFANAVMSATIEAKYSKTSILEAFINEVPLGDKGGKPVQGFGAASQFYFGKPFAQLEPQDIALLVALVSDPAGLDPRKSPDKALAARNAVLQADLQLNILKDTQVAGYTQTPLGVIPQPPA